MKAKKQRDELLAAIKSIAEGAREVDGQQFTAAIYDALDLVSRIEEEDVPWCPGDKLVGVCPGIESGVNSDCPRWKEEA